MSNIDSGYGTLNFPYKGKRKVVYIGLVVIENLQQVRTLGQWFDSPYAAENHAKKVIYRYKRLHKGNM